MDRWPVVAGQFYPGRPEELDSLVDSLLAKAGKGASGEPTVLAMAPHAGYVFSGGVAGITLGRAHLAETILLLGPNHTGRGRRFAVWPDGRWHVPGGSLAVDEELADALLSAETRLEPDTAAHLHEHSLEVMLPFLRRISPDTRILPLCVSETRKSDLLAVGRRIGQALEAFPRPVSLLVSSDMSHYVPAEYAMARDQLALRACVDLNPEALYDVVRGQNISMCGVLPMTVGLAAAVEMGAKRAEVAAYATSGEVNRDFSKVVGYAGVLVH